MNRWTFFVIIILMMAASCGQNDQMESNLAPCLEDRANTDTLTSQTGTLSVDGGIVLIHLSDPQQVLAPCNLPDSSATNSQEIKFSGFLKETYANERWAGTPIMLTDLELIP